MILLTGGSGLLGRELQKYIDCVAPTHAELDITDSDLELPAGVDCIVHAAAYTDVEGAERDHEACYRTNVIGTRNIAGLGVPVVYISTEYAFDGERGGYAESDPPSPFNYYAVTKVLGEEAVRAAPRSLVIRCIFKPRPFEHPRALIDQFTSGDYVDVIAPLVARVINARELFATHDTIHVGTGKKRIFDLARQTKDVVPLRRLDVKTPLPRDTSLDTGRFSRMFSEVKIDIDFAKPIFGDEEREAVNRVMRGHWLASGEENAAFEREFAEFVGVPYALAVNSGSSANLLALASLNLPRGSKVITSGCGFPATLSPILHLGFEPVLVDYDESTLNIDVIQTLLAIERSDARAVILAHTLGVPVNLAPILEAARARGVAVIEDCCEAIGATYRGRQVGSHGAMGTYSFYPSHQITALGGGGMVVFKSEDHYRRAKSLRDWGKRPDWDTYGRNNTKYSTEVDGIPYFPHYSYETVGWNMKLPEANCAFGREQLRRLPYLVEARAQRHAWIAERCGFYGQRIPDEAEPSWFGFPIVLNKEFDRVAFGDALEARGVRHRPFFAGNITRHVPFAALNKKLPVADYLMEYAVFIGCHPGMTRTDCEYAGEAVENAFALQMRDAA